MRRSRIALLVLFALVLLLGPVAPESALAGSCGLLPLKPLTPLGCRDLVPVCVCDSRGMNCHWTWQCVR